MTSSDGVAQKNARNNLVEMSCFLERSEPENAGRELQPSGSALTTITEGYRRCRGSSVLGSTPC